MIAQSHISFDFFYVFLLSSKLILLLKEIISNLSIHRFQPMAPITLYKISTTPNKYLQTLKQKLPPII